MERWKKRSRRGERRALTVIAVITILIVMAMIAFYVWGPRILEKEDDANPMNTENVPETTEEKEAQPTQTPNQTETIEILPVSSPNAMDQPDMQKTAERQIIPFTIITPQPEETKQSNQSNE